MNRFILLLFIFLLSSELTYAQDETEFYSYMEEGDYSNARVLLENNKGLDQSIHQLGSLYLKLGEYRLAEECFLKYLKSDSANVKWNLGLAQAYSLRAYNTKAEEVYLKLFEKDSTNTAVLLNLAKLNRRSSKDYYQRLMNLDSLNPNYPYQIGLYYSRKSDLYGSLDFFTRAHDLDPENIVYIIRIADVYFDLRKSDLALEYIDKGLELDSRNRTLLNLKMSALYKRKRYREVIEIGEVLVEKDRKNSNVLQYLGLSYMKLNQNDLAEKFLMSYWMLDTTNPMALYYLGLNYESVANYDKAVMMFQMARNANDKENDNIYYHLAQTYYQQKLPEKAYEYYSMAFKANSRMSDALYNLIILGKALDIDMQVQYKHLEKYFQYFESKDELKTAYVESEMKRVKRDLFMNGISVD